MSSIQEQFAALCDASRNGGPPPDLDSFLAGFEEPERSEVRRELESIAHSMLGGTVDHVVLPPMPAPPVGGTVDFLAGRVPQAQPLASPEGTVDHTPMEPGGTVDHVPTDPGGTVDHTAPTSPAGDLETVKTVGGYDVLGVLGRGAMGVVYKARQRGLKRLVALKMILAGDHASDRDLARFRSEAEAVAHLQHPNIVQIYEVGEDGGRPFFSLELVDGTSLDKKVKGTPLPPTEAAGLTQTLAEAMDYAHRNGIIHRDLKPANVLLTADGVPKIGDFGLAKKLDDESGVTHSGTILGTPSYMAPEQAEGRLQDVGPISDVYSLGAILYDLLTGRPPFRGTSMLDTLQQVRLQEPVAPTQLVPKVPRDLETICLKCLSKDPARRYATAGELAADLKRFLAGEPIQARPVGAVERAWRWTRRNPWTAATIAGVAALLVGWGASVTALAFSLKRQVDETVKARNQADDNAERARDTATKAVSRVVRIGERLHARLQSKRRALQGSPDLRGVRDELMNDLREGLGDLGREVKELSTSGFGEVATAIAMGDMLMKLGQVKDARESFQRGYEINKGLAENNPASDKARANLGVGEQRLGDVAMELEGDAAAAHAHYAEARRLRVEVRDKPRSNEYKPLEIRLAIAHDDVRLGRALLALGRPAEARRYFLEALEYREEWVKEDAKKAEPRGWALEARMYAGVASAHLGDAKAVENYFGDCLKVANDLVKEYPNFADFRADLAEVLGQYGDALLRLGRRDDAEKAYREAMVHLAAGLAGKPDDVVRLPQLEALMNERLGQLGGLAGKPPEAKKHFDAAKKLRLELFLLERGNLSRQMGYIVAAARCGDHAEAARLLNTVRPRMARSTELMLQVARAYANCAAADAAGRAGHVKHALEALAAATKDDYRAAFVLKTDPDLGPLHEEEGFRKVLAAVQARAE